MSPTKLARRRRSPHPGVRILLITSRSGRQFYQARFTDPDSNRLVCESLDAKGITTAETRRAWAAAKSDKILLRRAELRAGAQPNADVKIESAIERYMNVSEATLRPKTCRGYRDSMDQFARWTREMRILRTGQLNVNALALYREHIIQLPKRHAMRGGGRGAKAQADLGRAPRTTNRELTYIATALRAWYANGILPSLNLEGINSALRRVPGIKRQPRFLSFDQVRKLLSAAIAHDSQSFEMTRAEKIERLLKGETPRFAPVAPAVLFLLLSGARRGEAVSLRWPDVRLHARDEHGNEVGEVLIRVEASKTRSARTVDLGVSPALRRLLAAMHERRRDEESVFGLTEDQLVTAQRRLVRAFGAPIFNWQLLRTTCATVLANAGSIFGSSAAFRESKQLGHSITVAEEHYVGLLRGIPSSAKTIEAALQIEDLAEQVIAQVATRRVEGFSAA